MPVITPNTSLFHQIGEHLRRIVSLADDTIDPDPCIMMAVEAARPALAAYTTVRDVEWDTRDIRLHMVEDIMDLLSKNEDVRSKYYRGNGPDHFEKMSDSELVEAYKHVVMRCFRQR